MTIVSKRFARGRVGGIGSNRSSTLFEGLPRGMGSSAAAFAVRLRGGMGSSIRRGRRLAADAWIRLSGGNAAREREEVARTARLRR